jgi:acyl-coenzyme A synthetase/AMP-(fatty) acid ligase
MSTTVNLDVAPLHWIDRRPVDLDFGGPEAVTYTPLPERPEEVLSIAQVERVVRAHADKVAIFDGVVRLTYADLLDRIYGLAREIATTVEPGGVLAAVVHSGALAPVAVMTSVISGRVLALIDAGHPIERQRALFAELGASAVIVAEGEAIDDSFIPDKMPRISVDLTKPTRAEPFRNNFDPDRPLLIMFTSGSTGQPKGLAAGVASGAREVKAFVDKIHLNSNDVVVGLASPSQIGASGVMPLLTGAQLRIINLPRNGLTEALRIMDEEGITVLSFVPSILRSLMSIPGIEKALSHLRVLDLHGERLLASDVELFRSKLPQGCHINVTFGSTEAHGVFSWFVRDEEITGPDVPVGYLARGKAVAVVGEDGRPTPPGEVGELIVRGEMAIGSWQGGRLTRTRFASDPDDPKKLIYVTGDLVRMRPDGLFEFVGRRDRQVKIRGLWADLGAIETALREVDGISDAVVIAHANPGGADTLAAFVTVQTDAVQLSAAELRRHVAAATADHMTPSEIRFLPSIPRLANYKPDLVKLDGMLAQPPLA